MNRSIPVRVEIDTRYLEINSDSRSNQFPPFPAEGGKGLEIPGIDQTGESIRSGRGIDQNGAGSPRYDQGSAAGVSQQPHNEARGLRRRGKRNGIRRTFIAELPTSRDLFAADPSAGIALRVRRGCWCLETDPSGADVSSEREPNRRLVTNI